MSAISLPKHRYSREENPPKAGNESFVDEAVARRMVMGGAYQRMQSSSQALVLSSSEDDYAGWNLPSDSSFSIIS